MKKKSCKEKRFTVKSEKLGNVFFMTRQGDEKIYALGSEEFLSYLWLLFRTHSRFLGEFFEDESSKPQT